MFWFTDNEPEAVLFHCQAILIIRIVKASYDAPYSPSLKHLFWFLPLQNTEQFYTSPM